MRSTMVRSMLLTLLVVPLGACSAAGGTSDADRGAGSESHTMADGAVMDGERHVHDDGHTHGDSPGDGAPVGPSAAARMICTGQVVEDVTRVMGLERAVEPESSWTKPMFTCTFGLPAGPLVLSVHDAADPTTGEAHFRTLRASRADATPINGVYSLGLPAYETADGTVAFVKDGRTLEVDATALRGLPASQELTRTEIAYAVAASVLACWTEHG